MIQAMFIPGWHPVRLNNLFGKHWAKAARLKAEDRKVIRIYARMNELLNADKVKRRVSFKIVLKPKQRAGDPDAYYKSLLDGLVWAGLLVDDSRTWCEITQPTFDRGEQWGTEITLEDLP